jgi:hypothetical protein
MWEQWSGRNAMSAWRSWSCWQKGLNCDPHELLAGPTVDQTATP